MAEKIFNLAERTAQFACEIRELIKSLPRTVASIEDIKQLTRSSGSVAANYLEADEAVSKPDFIHKIKICKKEARESGLWLSLLPKVQVTATKHDHLIQESKELVRIFEVIVRNTKL